MNLLTEIHNLSEISEILSRESVTAPPERYPYFREAAINALATKTKIEMWHNYGDKTFILAPELVEAFQHTDVPMDIYPPEFKYPFECFTIESDIPLFETNTGYVEINGKRVGRDKSTNVYTIMYISRQFVERVAGETQYIRPDGTMSKGLDWDHSICAYFPGENNTGLETITLNLRNDTTIRYACEKKKEGLLITELEATDGRSLVNLFLNTIMYVNDPTRKIEYTEEYRRRKVKLKGHKKAVKMGYTYLKPPRNYLPLSTASSGHLLEKRFIVRGHYRNQAHGTQRALRKRIWIQPYWKGPEWSERMNRPYKIN